MQEAAQRICDYLFRHLGDPETGRHDCVLVRCFVTQTFQQLDPRSQRCAADLGPGHPLPADVKCLTLMGTAGVRPEWNDRERSRRYRSIPLAGRQFVSRLPMFSQLLHQLGVELESDAVDTNLLTNGTDRTFNVFLVPEAHGSPYVPVQDDFVIPYGVASVLGFGAVLAPQVFFTVILFSTQPLTRDTADLFKPLALSAKLSLLPFVEHRPGRRVLRVERSPPQWRARAETLEQLLAVHEETVAYHTHQHARAQAARRAGEEQYRLLVMQANDIIYRTDRMGRFTFVNPTATRIMQYTDEELVGRRFLELIRADYRPAVERFYGRQFVRKRHNTYYEFPAIAKDGHEVWIGQHVQLLQQDGEVAGFQAVARDITARRRAEELLRRSEAFVSSVIDHLPNMVFVKDAQDLRFVRLNKAGETLLGYSCAELIGKTDVDFFPREEAAFFRAMDRQVLDSGRLLDIPEEPIETKYHGQRLLHTKKIPIYDEQGRPQYLLGISEDITERKAAERRLRDTLEQIRQLSGRLATVQEEERARIARELHDELGVRLSCFKIDLSHLQGAVSDLRDAAPRERMGARIRNMIEPVDATIASVQELVSQLRPAVLDDLGLVAAIEWQCQDVQRRTGMPCTCSTSAEDIAMDPDQATALFRICQEALTNVARHAHANAVTVTLQEAGGVLRLEVTDDGVGIPPAKIADPRSLGLLGMRERMARLGGDLTVRGQPWQGTTVIATLARRSLPPHHTG